mgnify:CR=1 FL=1
MAIKGPTIEDILGIAESYGFPLEEQEAGVYKRAIEQALDSYAFLETLAETKPAVKYARRAGRKPTPQENPLGAIAWLCDIRGASSGKLFGKTLAIKDNASVFGMPMMNGSRLMEGYIADIDASVVTRILDAGGRIVAKSVCDSFCFAATGHTPDSGCVRNPVDPSRLASGSSGGSAALVGSGFCDMALGGDQGGSIRMPASWCGVVGLKPTYGLVPYTGLFSIEPTLDHAGPIAKTVADCALLLEVLQGKEELDWRQAACPDSLSSYLARLDDCPSPLRVGIVKEGFGWEVSEQEVDESVRRALAKAAAPGLVVEEVSIPMHRQGIHFWNGVGIEGTYLTMIRDEGVGHGHLGFYDSHLASFYGVARRQRGFDYSPTVRMVLLLGHFMRTAHTGRYYAKAQNLRGLLKNAYDEALGSFHVLAMPTTPMRAYSVQSFDTAKTLDYGLRPLLNTAPLDVTGHPAISIPAGKVDGLPVGLMLVAKTFDELTLFQAANALEAAFSSL